MAIRIVNYRGFQLRAAAFEVAVLEGFKSSLLIHRLSESNGEYRSEFLEPKATRADGLFLTEEDAIAAAIALGEEVVDKDGITSVGSNLRRR